ncbi:hypothetical protein [Schumannella luteola]
MSDLVPHLKMIGQLGREPGDVRRQLESYLRREGWIPQPGGGAGDLWERDGTALAVPYEVKTTSQEFAAIARRIAAVESRDVDAVVVSLEREYQDVQNYRISDGFVIDGSVQLEAATTVMTSARRLIRAAATTARKPRANIGSNYSGPADLIASRARLSHTREGSFLLPVVMPVDPPTPGEDEVFTNEAVIEPGERRVTRTLATALAALDSIAVRPDREPNADGLWELVQRGVSRELVAAVRAVAVDSGVHAFDASFDWAPGLGSPGRIPSRVVIAGDAATLLSRVEERLSAAPPDENQTVSGQIAEIRHIPEEPTGEISIRTIRNSRLVEVRVTVNDQAILDAHDWAKHRRAVLARGAITVAGGRLFMVNPDAVVPIDDLFVVPEDDLT